MKKILLSLIAMVFAIGVNATEVVLNSSSGTWTGDENGYTATINGYKISYLKHNATSNCVAPSNDHIRIYKYSMFVIEAVDGSAITSLEMTTPGGNYCFDMDVEGGNAIAKTPLICWTGNTTKFEGVANYGQIRIKSIKINESSSPEPEIEGTGEGTIDSPYDVKRALSIINNGKYTTQKVYVKGKISKIESIDTGEYGNATYFISDDGTESAQLEIFRGYYYNGNRFTTGNEIKVGDEVVVCGVLTLYGTTSEMTSGSSIYTINGKPYEKPEYKPVGDGSLENPYTVEDIVGMEINTSDGNKYWVKGYIIGNASSKDKLNEGDKIGDTNIALGATATATSFIPVALPTDDVRKALGIKTNPGNVGKEVMVYGTLEAYFSTAGVKNVKEYILIDPTSINNITANTINTPIINLNGQVVPKDYKGVIIKNGKKFISK